MGVEEDILQLEMKINQLRIEYDQYFSAITKIPPYKLQDEIKRFIRLYSTRRIQNTGQNFRYNNLVSKYTTFESMWKRHMQAIEDGTLKRGKGFSPGMKVKKDEPIAANETPAERLYKEYVSARQGLKQNTDDIKVQNLQAMIEKQTAAIKAKYKVSAVEYKVVTEGGVAKIKAVPKK